MATLEEIKERDRIKKERRAAEDALYQNFFQRNLGGMFNEGGMFGPDIDPNRPVQGQVVGSPAIGNFPAVNTIADPRVNPNLLSGISVDPSGNIVPGANNTLMNLNVASPAGTTPGVVDGTTATTTDLVGQAGTGVPSFVNRQPVSFSLNPDYKQGQLGDPIRGSYLEYDVQGRPDTTLGSIIRKRKLGGQERSTYTAGFDDLKPGAKERITKISDELQKIEDPEARILFVNDPKNRIYKEDISEDSLGKFDMRKGAISGTENQFFNQVGGGPLDRASMQPNFGALTSTNAGLLTDRIPSVPGKSSYIGNTVEQTIDAAGMKLAPGGQIALPGGLEYTGDNVPFSSPAIQADIAAAGPSIDPQGYKNIMDNYVNKNMTDDAAGIFAGVDATQIVGLLGNVMMMQSLLDNKTPMPTTIAAPRGVTRAPIPVDDPYRRRF